MLLYGVLTAEYKRRSRETGEEVTAVSSPGGRRAWWLGPGREEVVPDRTCSEDGARALDWDTADVGRCWSSELTSKKEF